MTGWAGWTGEEKAPAMPTTSLLMARGSGQRRPGGVLEAALAGARAEQAREERERAAAAMDADDYAAGFIGRGYTPGLLSQLSQRLADVEGEQAAEEEKIAKAAKRSERAMREHAAGRLPVAALMRMDLDGGGDPAKVERLARRAESLRRQIREASALMAPQPQRALDPAEAACAEARELLAEAGLAPTARSVRIAEHIVEARRAEEEAAAAARAQLAAEHKGFRARLRARFQ